jgi:hypothetical protein
MNGNGAGTDIMALMPLALGLLSGATGDASELGALKHKLRTWAKDDPMDAVMATVLGGGLAFYLAEKDTNAQIGNAWDGILYMVHTLAMGSTTETKPTTATGHALASFVQTFGPALALSAFDPTAAEKKASAAEQQAVQLAILERLDRIVQLLEKQPV